MEGFPSSREEIRRLAEELVKFLKGEMDATVSPRKWNANNFELLDTFFRGKHCTGCQFRGSPDGPEFLWDFEGHVGFKGLLVAAESEYNAKCAEIEKDFDRLLYGISPLKLMICRIGKKFRTVESAREAATNIRLLLERNLRENSIHYCSGEVFILYCSWWWADGDEKKDFAYILQVDGEPNYVPVRKDQEFEPLPG